MLHKMITENSVSTILSLIPLKDKWFGKLVDSNISVVTLFSQYFGIVLLNKHDTGRVKKMQEKTSIFSDNFHIFHDDTFLKQESGNFRL